MGYTLSTLGLLLTTLRLHLDYILTSLGLYLALLFWRDGGLCLWHLLVLVRLEIMFFSFQIWHWDVPAYRAPDREKTASVWDGKGGSGFVDGSSWGGEAPCEDGLSPSLLSFIDHHFVSDAPLLLVFQEISEEMKNKKSKTKRKRDKDDRLPAEVRKLVKKKKR